MSDINKCIAIPLENGVLCAHFGHCEEFAIVQVENNQIKEIKTHTPPEHIPGLYPRWVAGFGVTDVITGGMGQKAINLFNQQNINAFVGAPMMDARSLVMAFLEDKLQLSANYCDQQGHTDHHGRGHGCRH